MSEKSREDEQAASSASPASVPDWLALPTVPERKAGRPAVSAV